MFRRSDATERLRAVQVTRSPAELIEAIDDPSPEVARAAVSQLAKLEGGRAAAALRERLLTSDLALTRHIARTLRRIGDPTAADLALTGLHESSYVRRLAAARALREFADRRAAEALEAALHDPVAGVRAEALSAIVELGPSERSAIECARLLSDRNAHVRVAAVRAVARLGRRPGNLIAPAAHDPDWLIRLEVARHAASLPAEVARELLGDRELRVREAAAGAAGPEQVGTLALLLTDDPSNDVRIAAARALGGLRDERLGDVLVAGVDDRDPVVRAAVLRALQQLLTRSGAVRRLCRELTSSRPTRRRAAIYALAHLPEPRQASEVVARLADDPDADVRLALIHTATELHLDPRPLIRSLSEDPDPAVSQAAELWLMKFDK
jgi:HEAT repeat protein